MKRFQTPLVVLLALLAVPSVAYTDRAVPPGRPLPGGFGAPGPGYLGKRIAPQEPNIAPQPLAQPHPSGAAVIELLEDDAGRMARILAAGDDPAKLAKSGAWGEDCFSGNCCLKVNGYQSYRSNIPGWAYPIVEKPRPGEYRYLRFAWKRSTGNGIMVQLAVSGGTDWGRYFAGQNTVGFYPALSLKPEPPREWEVVTRDLYTDFGGVPFNLTGFAFTSMDGVALFDHIYLGRTIEDLDKVTNAAREWARKTETLGSRQLETYWKDLASEDAALRQPAVWALGACGSTSLPFLKARVKVPDSEETERRIKTAVAELDSPRFIIREKAFKYLEEVGLPALVHLEQALKDGISTEWRMRLEKLIAKCKAEEGVLTGPQRVTLRVIHILELTESAEAKKLLEELSKASLEAALSLDAKAALDRLEKRKK
jgi:hypothetical protein